MSDFFTVRDASVGGVGSSGSIRERRDIGEKEEVGVNGEGDKVLIRSEIGIREGLIKELMEEPEVRTEVVKKIIKKLDENPKWPAEKVINGYLEMVDSKEEGEADEMGRLAQKLLSEDGFYDEE